MTMYELKKTNELDINYFVNLAKEKVGYVGDMVYVRTFEKCGTFEILDFEVYDEPHFNYWKNEDVPISAKLGVFVIKFTDTKFYNNKVMRFEVTASVQSKYWGLMDDLYIGTINLDNGKRLKAYEFPILNDTQNRY